MGKVIRFPHPVTPKELADHLLEEIDGVESLIIVAANADGYVISHWAENVGHSNLPKNTEPETRTVLEATAELTLRCGDAELTLRRDGTIVLSGSYVLSRASGTNKILGGAVVIN